MAEADSKEQTKVNKNEKEVDETYIQKGVSLVLVTLLVFSGLVGVLSFLPQESEATGLANSPWPMFYGGPKHTGRSPYDTSHVDGTGKWNFSPGLDVESSPAIDSDCTIYVGSEDVKLYAFGSSGSGTDNTPSAPQNLQASGGDQQVELTRDASSDDGGSSITEYKIYRGTSSGDLSYHESVGGNTTSHTDNGLINDQTYYYQVSAVNSEGEGDLSAEVSATPLTEDGQSGDGTDNGTDNGTDGGNGGTPGFTTMLLLLSTVVAVAIYYEKKR